MTAVHTVLKIPLKIYYLKIPNAPYSNTLIITIINTKYIKSMVSLQFDLKPTAIYFKLYLEYRV